MAKYFYKHERPSVTVDSVIFTIVDEHLKVLLIQRKASPFKDSWALPGGFVGMDESLDEAALRELKEETNISDIYLEQFHTFGKPKRDPRTRVITVAYFALISSDKVPELKAKTDAADVDWFSIHYLPLLAFDHRLIIEYALERLRNKLNYTAIAFQLMPEKFTLTELQKVYEIILDRELVNQNFRKNMKMLGILKEHEECKSGGRRRPERLYSFAEQKSNGLMKLLGYE